MASLIVNVDHVGTLRAADDAAYPDPVAAAILAELAGADGIGIHVKEDRREIKDRDIRILRSVVQNKLVLKMASTPEMAGVALELKPDLVILAPEKRDEFSPEGGLDLMVHKNTIAETVDTLQSSGISVCIFIDPDPDQIKLAHQLDVAMVEFQTATFCSAFTTIRKKQAFTKIVNAIKLTRKLKISVCAGAGLCYNTIQNFKGLNEIEMYVIGHSIISRAVLVGMERAVKEMIARIKDL
ncbi:pyridoxine 5'-phosphate synthase [Thermodesulfobacteriota bacterium]